MGVEKRAVEIDSISVGGLGMAMKVDDEKLIVKYTNFRSILNKRDEMAILMESTEIDIFGITESWTHGDISDEELHITRSGRIEL